MHSFADSTGNTWIINITIGAAKRVRDLAGVDLLALTEGDPPLMTHLETDIALLCDVIFAIVRPQAEKININDTQFAELLGGEVIRTAHDAFWSALLDFFRSLGREDTARAIEKQNELLQAVVRASRERIEAISTAEVIGEAIGEPSVS